MPYCIFCLIYSSWSDVIAVRVQVGIRGDNIIRNILFNRWNISNKHLWCLYHLYIWFHRSLDEIKDGNDFQFSLSILTSICQNYWSYSAVNLITGLVRNFSEARCVFLSTWTWYFNFDTLVRWWGIRYLQSYSPQTNSVNAMLFAIKEP